MDPTIAPHWLKLLLLLRLIAFMALIYALFGLLVEARSRKPDSKLKGFAHLICRPLTQPVAMLFPGLAYPQLLRRTTWLIAGLWLLITIASELVFASARS